MIVRGRQGILRSTKSHFPLEQIKHEIGLTFVYRYPSFREHKGVSWTSTISEQYETTISYRQLELIVYYYTHFNLNVVWVLEPES